MEAIKVIISKDMEWQLEYSDWDIDEMKQELPKAFPGAKVIEVTDCELSYLEVNIDGEYFVLDVEGTIIERGRM
jgi:hypothetical protein